MATDYEKVYRGTKNALGGPTRQFVEFFGKFEKTGAEILDIGCGQGRDALFIARLGHHVTAVDISSTGIRDMLNDAANEELHISGKVVDLRNYQPENDFDVVLADRTLHMLNEFDRVALLERLLPCIISGGYLLIADERSKIQGFTTVIEASEYSWKPILKDRGYLFLERTG